MSNKTTLPLRAISLIALVILLFTSECGFAQSTYKEIEVYRSLLDKSARDSCYIKALISNGMKPLSENEPSTELAALSRAFTNTFWGEPKDYGRAFVLAVELEKRLAGVDQSNFGGRKEAYVKLGEAYYIFKDYATSVRLLANVIDAAPLSFWDCSHLEALRISGICYANMSGMMPRSDSCFMAMMLCDDVVLNRPVYDALALSNLGCNAMMQGDYDKALALDLEVLPRLKQESDYGHIAGMYSCQGFSYLGKGDYGSLRTVIDSISRYAHKDYYNRNKRLKQAYTLKGKYYSGVGDARAAQLYSDSLVAIYKAEESEYTSQFISDARRVVGDREIRLQQERVERQRELIVFVLIILGVILAGMVVIVRLYGKRNAAYKALARKAQEWALVGGDMTVMAATDVDNLKEETTQEDRDIMSLLDHKMVVDCAYREKNLTMDELADRLGVRRHLLSRAVNRVTGANFYQYVNGYRIKEAVRFISKHRHEELYINELYERVGFTNRTTFYRVFKQFTGLSPLEFQKSGRGENS